MRRSWQIMTRSDVVVVISLLLIGLTGVVWLFAAPQGQRVLVSDGERILFLGRLDQPVEVDLDGSLGTTHLVIDRQGARITRAPCPLKICMGMGPALHQGDLIACVPNRILIQVKGDGGNDDPYDFISR
jgi:hypothetical protein